MPPKGNGYDAGAIVGAALQRSGLPPEKFFHCAQHFERSKPFDSSVEARKFSAWQAGENGHVGYSPPPVARAFADWVLVADPKKVVLRIQLLSTVQ